jgi:hypothetical protein
VGIFQLTFLFVRIEANWWTLLSWMLELLDKIVNHKKPNNVNKNSNETRGVAEKLTSSIDV